MADLVNTTVTLQLKDIAAPSAHAAVSLAYKHATTSSISDQKEWSHAAQRMVTTKTRRKNGAVHVLVTHA